ncbi:MAG TPA: DUF5777 family beta-barrel protein [Cytophagaceae bacterium]|jgi:hypothetical protein|nr:DUF5777 family beta-barrel protein [Cytophagaceae bacterium]
MKYFLLIFVFGISISLSNAQDDLMNLLDKETKDSAKTEYAYATFKGNRVINGQSVETIGKHTLSFIISHRFGPFNSGPHKFYGIDIAYIRLGFEYGITDRLEVGVGRSNFNEMYDGYWKYKLLRQSKGARVMPVSVVLFSSTAATSAKATYSPDKFSYRLYYTYQIIIARKFSESLSLQLSPTLVHRNLVDNSTNKNDVFAVGFSGRFKLTKRISLNAEYFYLLPHQATYRQGTKSVNCTNALSVGVDIETGGHVFQIHCTNSIGMIEKSFIAENNGKWSKGAIMLGFNVTRPFNLGKNKKQ